MSARNEITGAEYRGKNVERLLVAELTNGYDESHGWAGYRQWIDAGRVVKRGEHGTPCLTVVTVAPKDGGAATRKPRGFRVFHYDQTTELEGSPEGAERPAAAMIARAVGEAMANGAEPITERRAS